MQYRLCHKVLSAIILKSLSPECDGLDVADSFASNHASQCGFCTPGFVVACHSTLAQAAEAGMPPTTQAMMQGLDGNLCRCTGYTTILEACKVLQPFPQTSKAEATSLLSKKDIPRVYL